ncbi:MAG: putative toxin-antitoxin system toxin component, PIN family [Verrucomicrobiota bacterium]
MKIVVDSNTLVSGSLWNGPPARLLDAIRSGKLTLVQSPVLWVEFVEVLSRPKFAARLRLEGLTPTLVADGLRRYVTWIPNSQIPLPPELRDPKDLLVLAAAVCTKADAVVTGDNDLISMNSFEGIPILNARAMLEKLGIAVE